MPEHKYTGESPEEKASKKCACDGVAPRFTQHSMDHCCIQELCWRNTCKPEEEVPTEDWMLQIRALLPEDFKGEAVDWLRLKKFDWEKAAEIRGMEIAKEAVRQHGKDEYLRRWGSGSTYLVGGWDRDKRDGYVESLDDAVRTIDQKLNELRK